MDALQQSGNATNDSLLVVPWPHLIIDNFLSQDALQQSLLEIGRDTYDFHIEARGTGRIEFSLLKSERLWREIYSKRTISLLSSNFDTDVSLNRDNFVQLRRMNDDTPEFPMHNDFTSNQDSIASFLYLSPGWTLDRGGRLHLFESETDQVPSASIEPLQNRFIAFRTKREHWHSVEGVKGWERISALSLWNCAD